MSPFLYILLGATVALVFALLWLLRNPVDTKRKGWNPEDGERSHIQYFPQVQQAMSREDQEFLLARLDAELARTVGRERRLVVLRFLGALGREFNHLMCLARVIASLSPQVAPMEEFERFRLTMTFHWRLRFVRAKLALGTQVLPDLGAASDLVSRLRVRMDAAITELGERAALATELVSAIERGDAHLA